MSRPKQEEAAVAKFSAKKPAFTPMRWAAMGNRTPPVLKIVV
jgi:hypothetical protein